MTQQWLIDIGPYCLEVETDGRPDFDSEFSARCLDTGERLRIKGWLISNYEPLSDTPDALDTTETADVFALLAVPTAPLSL